MVVCSYQGDHHKVKEQFPPVTCSATSLTGETGTYVYMAPEMVRHEPYTGKADVYSWGVLLAETLSQRPPYEGLYLTPVQAGRPWPDPFVPHLHKGETLKP